MLEPGVYGPLVRNMAPLNGRLEVAHCQVHGQQFFVESTIPLLCRRKMLAEVREGTPMPMLTLLQDSASADIGCITCYAQGHMRDHWREILINES